MERQRPSLWASSSSGPAVRTVSFTLLCTDTNPPRSDAWIGRAEVLDPANLCTVYCSPRIRAHRTFHLLFDHLGKLPAHTITEEVREWDYGDYEGLKPAEIQKKSPGWFIWRDGCPGGESVEEMAMRVDNVIAKVRVFCSDVEMDDTDRSGPFFRRCVSTTGPGWKRARDPGTSSSSPTVTSTVSSSRAGSGSRSASVSPSPDVGSIESR